MHRGIYPSGLKARFCSDFSVKHEEQKRSLSTLPILHPSAGYSSVLPSPGRAPKRAASTPQNGPQDHFACLRQDGVDPAETLLHALIGECHTIIRDDVVPASRSTPDTYERARFYQSAVDLVRIATGAVDAITRLRGGVTDGELRQRITVERVQSGPPRSLRANPKA